jgi:LmbE family N-acetylglucosaminyl deacetylase
MDIDLFLFAHQDDECGVFEAINTSLMSKKIVHCFFFTSGTLNGLNSKYRDEESQKVLLMLGVKIQNIYFIGSEFCIPDCKLVNYLDFTFQFILKILNNYNKDNINIYLPALEGGHPDHDALHIAGVSAAHSFGLIQNTYQYPLYNGSQCIGPFFRVLSPLIENGDVMRSKITFYNRLRFLGFCLRYPSQRKTWIGLFPFFVHHYFFWGTQVIQAVSICRLRQRPHPGKLYYERRKFSTWEKMRIKFEFFLENKIKE